MLRFVTLFFLFINVESQSCDINNCIECDLVGQCKQCVNRWYGPSCQWACPSNCAIGTNCNNSGDCEVCQYSNYGPKCDKFCPFNCQDCLIDGSCPPIDDDNSSQKDESIMSLGIGGLIGLAILNICVISTIVWRCYRCCCKKSKSTSNIYEDDNRIIELVEPDLIV
jgi:hypothetical protein